MSNINKELLNNKQKIINKLLRTSVYKQFKQKIVIQNKLNNYNKKIKIFQKIKTI